MELKELRIGNLYINDQNDVAKVLEIEISGVVGDTTEYGKFTNKNLIRPIELSGKWLSRIGFKKDENGDYINKQKQYLDLSEVHNGFNLWIDGELIQDVKVKYVHQLQNLYFALTGEELKPQDVAIP